MEANWTKGETNCIIIAIIANTNASAHYFFCIIYIISCMYDCNIPNPYFLLREVVRGRLRREVGRERLWRHHQRRKSGHQSRESELPRQPKASQGELPQKRSLRLTINPTR